MNGRIGFIMLVGLSALLAGCDGDRPGAERRPPEPRVFTEELALEGLVVDVLNPRSVVLRPKTLPQEEILVVVRGGSTGLEKGAAVRFSGRAERTDRRALAREIGVDVVPRLESRRIDWSTVFVATDHRPAASMELAATHPPEEKEAAQETTEAEMKQKKKMPVRD